jgi:hypothetical protein
MPFPSSVIFFNAPCAWVWEWPENASARFKITGTVIASS